MKRTERIQAMEKILNSYTDVLANFEKALDVLVQNREDYIKLRDYYSSEQWFKDVDAYNEGKLPEDLDCGVLSEDAVFDLIGDRNRMGIRLLEEGTRMVKEF